MRKSKSAKGRTRHLRRATALGTVSLLWAVVTVNIFLIIASICSWTASSGGRKASARAAEVLYILGGITSTLLVLLIALVGNVFSVISGIYEIFGGTAVMLGAAAVFDVLIALAAINSHKGCAELALEVHEPDNVGFFDSNEIYFAPEDDD